MTTCEYPDSPEAYRCITEEQCDECYAIDHPEEQDEIQEDTTSMEEKLEALTNLTEKETL
jgi:hypothetical protein